MPSSRRTCLCLIVANDPTSSARRPHRPDPRGILWGSWRRWQQSSRPQRERKHTPTRSRCPITRCWPRSRPSSTTQHSRSCPHSTVQSSRKCRSHCRSHTRASWLANNSCCGPSPNPQSSLPHGNHRQSNDSHNSLHMCHSLLRSHQSSPWLPSRRFPNRRLNNDKSRHPQCAPQLLGSSKSQESRRTRAPRRASTNHTLRALRLRRVTLTDRHLS